jgi:hypothetical protein
MSGMSKAGADRGGRGAKAPMDESHDSGSDGTGMDPVSRLAVFTLLVNLFLVGIKLLLSEISGSLALRADVLIESAVLAALAGHDRQKSHFDF